ncbi:DsbA family protein [Parvularcula lutaonensis]|uniref:DsbA family protein n=1 Tax=Parvularcula lutaonensis TaxID=491923 RepID=A0ABV7M7D0_9PROT|nr:DsbA family protein [Parvularcula lutaonensis]GGY41506.1 membrane protein [Parvularcula lutaonensis]
MALRSALLFTAVLLSACGASAPSGAEAQTTQMSDEEFDRRLRESLMRNPEVILEAIEAYRASLEAEAALATRESVAGYLSELVRGEAGHAIGASADEADLVVVEFFDYHCGFCRSALGDVLALVEGDPGVRVVFQELPILREESRDAAEIALAAAKLDSDAYRKVHQALFQASGVLDDKAIDNAIKRAGLRPSTVRKIAKEQADAIDATVDRSMEIAQAIGVQGTPFFIVANPDTGTFDVLEGFRSEEFAALVESVRGQ